MTKNTSTYEPEMTLVAATTRPVYFTHTRRGHVTDIECFPIGTHVYVERIDETGMARTRVCGTLWEQRIHLSDLDPDC